MSENIDKEWPADIIKKLRTRPSVHHPDQKMRQVDLAKQIGVDPRTVQQWENGDRTPGNSSLKQLVQVFLHEGKLVVGSEEHEAKALWNSVKNMAEARSLTGREFPSFDDVWFAQLLQAHQVWSRTPDQSNDGVAVAADNNRHAIESSSPTKMMGNIQQQTIGFIGREQQIAQIGDLLHTGSVVSIIGAGGIGKTAIALRIAQTLREHYAGIWMMELASLRDAKLLNHYLLSVLGLQHQPGRTELDVLLDYVQNKRLLFILDNCEHLIDESAWLIEQLIAVNPQLHLIVTSRESLNIAAEQVYRLPPLTTPEMNESEYLAEHNATAPSESVQLFIARAQAVMPQRIWSQQDIQGIENICRRLEGIPLAIELTAARLNILSIQQISERLSHLLTFLTAGRRTAAPRQQTLKATIDWSYSLLNEREQQLLQRLSVFARSFTLDAVEAVCVSNEKETEDASRLHKQDMLDLLSSLVNKSLVLLEEQEDSNFVRYNMLETIREYAHGKLQTEQSAAAAKNLYTSHARYYAHQLQHVALMFRTNQRDECLHQVRLEYSNLRMAMQSAHDGEVSSRIGMQIASSLYWFWLHEGMGIEGLLWLKRFIEHTAEQEMEEADYEALATAYHGSGVIQLVLGRLDEAEQSVQHSLDLSSTYNYDILRAASLRLRSFLNMHGHRLSEAVACAQESIDIARTCQDAWNLASSLHALGRMKLLQGHVEDSAHLFKESIHWFEQTGDQWELSGPYESLGYHALGLAQYQESIDYFKKSISISQIYKGTWIFIRSMKGMLTALYHIGRYREAAILMVATDKYRQQELTDTKIEWMDDIQIESDWRQQWTEQEWADIVWQAERLSRSQLVAYCLEC